MRFLILILHALLVSFAFAQTSSTSNSRVLETSASGAASSSLGTDAGHEPTTSSNPVSATQSDYGHGSTSAPLSSVASAQSTAGQGKQSASATTTGSSNGHRAVAVEGTGVVLAGVAFVLAWM